MDVESTENGNVTCSKWGESEEWSCNEVDEMKWLGWFMESESYYSSPWLIPETSWCISQKRSVIYSRRTRTETRNDKTAQWRMRIITHAGVGWAFSCVCLFVCLLVPTLKGKRLELSTPNLIYIYSIAVARHALTQRSKGQRSRSHGYDKRHGRTVAGDMYSYGRVLLLLAWVCMSIWLSVFSSYYYYNYNYDIIIVVVIINHHYLIFPVRRD